MYVQESIEMDIKEEEISLKQVQGHIERNRQKIEEEGNQKGKQDADIQSLRGEIKAKEEALKDLQKQISGSK